MFKVVIFNIDGTIDRWDSISEPHAYSVCSAAYMKPSTIMARMYADSK
jgi:hypothetical protein